MAADVDGKLSARNMWAVGQSVRATLPYRRNARGSIAWSPLLFFLICGLRIALAKKGVALVQKLRTVGLVCYETESCRRSGLLQPFIVVLKIPASHCDSCSCMYLLRFSWSEAGQRIVDFFRLGVLKDDRLRFPESIEVRNFISSIRIFAGYAKRSTNLCRRELTSVRQHKHYGLFSPFTVEADDDESSVSIGQKSSGQSVRLVSLTSIEPDDQQGQDFQPKAWLLQIVKKTVAKALLLFLWLGGTIIGLWEIEFEVPRQSDVLHAAFRGVSGIVLILLAQGCLFYFLGLTG